MLLLLLLLMWIATDEEDSALSSDRDSDLDERQRKASPPSISVEFAAVHSARSMAIGYLSGGGGGKPVTKMLRQLAVTKGRTGTKSRKRCRGDTSVSVFGTSVSLVMLYSCPDLCRQERFAEHDKFILHGVRVFASAAITQRSQQSAFRAE